MLPDVQPADMETRYRAAWIAILRRLTIAKILRYAAAAAFVASLLNLLTRGVALTLLVATALMSIATQLLIRCPRCGAWWPAGSGDDGQRKPCKKCNLHWGQEDDLLD